MDEMVEERRTEVQISWSFIAFGDQLKMISWM